MSFFLSIRGVISATLMLPYPDRMRCDARWRTEPCTPAQIHVLSDMQWARGKGKGKKMEHNRTGFIGIDDIEDAKMMNAGEVSLKSAFPYNVLGLAKHHAFHLCRCPISCSYGRYLQSGLI